MSSTTQIFVDFLKLSLSPTTVLFGFYEVLMSWLNSRRWWNVVFTIPLVVLLGFMAWNVGYFGWYGKEQLADDYWSVIESEMQLDQSLRLAEIPEPEVASGQQETPESASTNVFVSEETISAFAEALLRKTWQLENSDNRATFLIATSLAKRGVYEQARYLMRSIAPGSSKGYLPAHAWLAADRLQRLGASSQPDRELLLHDLSMANQWSGSGPVLKSVYADFLVQSGRVGEAIGILEAARKQDPNLRIKLATLAKQHRRSDLFESIRGEMLTIKDERIDRGLGTEDEYTAVASVLQLDNQIEQAAAVAQAGLNRSPNSAPLRRLLSDIYVTRFIEIRDNAQVTEQDKLALLDLAMKSDSTNPVVQEHIAELVASGSLSSPTVVARLRQQLATGKATAATHLLLAIGHLREGELEEALVHLEVANGLSSNNPFILNNLALCIARIRPNDLPRARELIELALSVSGPDAECLDTYGEILAQSKDYLGAIRAFDNALSVDPTRSGTRKKLAETYENVGMQEMAESIRNYDQPASQ